MQQGAGGAGAQVRWQRPTGSSFEVIPASNYAVNIDYNVLVDLTENDFDGTLTNGVSYDSANGGALSFDGIDDYVTINNQLDPIADGLFADGSSAWTVSSWFLPDTSNMNPGVISGKSSDIGNTATYAVWTEGTNLRARLRGGTIFTISDSLSNTWNEVVITWDGSEARTYLNGVEVNTMAVGTAGNQTNSFVVGATSNGDNTRFRGNIGETKVYDRALNTDEILQNFNVNRSRFGL